MFLIKNSHGPTFLNTMPATILCIAYYQMKTKKLLKYNYQVKDAIVENQHEFVTNLYRCEFSSKESKFQSYNHFHNILRLFGVLPNFPFTISETMCDYYLQTWYIRIA